MHETHAQKNSPPHTSTRTGAYGTHTTRSSVITEWGYRAHGEGTRGNHTGRPDDLYARALESRTRTHTYVHVHIMTHTDNDDEDDTALLLNAE